MTTSQAVIDLHFEATDHADTSWVHLVPAGTFTGRDGRGPYRVADVGELVRESEKAAIGGALVIDYNHAVDVAAPKGQPSPAAGWVYELAARKDGVWGKVSWTAEASRHLAAREYRYISPVLSHDSDGNILRLERASLVNNPNLGQLKSLFQEQPNVSEDDFMNFLRDALGLGDFADRSAIAAALATRLNPKHSAAPDPSQFVPIALFQQALNEANKLRQGISLQAAERRVDDEIKAGKILPFMRQWAVDLCTHSVASFDDFVKGVGPGFSHLLKPMRESWATPADDGETSSIHTEIANQLGIDPKLMRDSSSHA